MHSDDLVDNIDDLTGAKIQATKAAKQIGGRLAVGFVTVVFIACLLIAIFFVGDTSFIIGTIGSFFFSAGLAFYLGEKIGFQVLVQNKSPFGQGILLSLFISVIAGSTGGIIQSLFDQFRSVYLLDMLAFAIVSLVTGFIPSLFLGWIYGLILNSYRTKFQYVDDEEE